MLRSILAALLLASPLSAQVVSVKALLPVFTGAPGPVPVQAPALNGGFSPSVLETDLTLSHIPVLNAPVPAQGAKAIEPLQLTAQQIGGDFRVLPSALARLYDGTVAQGEPAGPVPSAGAPVRTLQSITQLKTGSYNIENLFEHVGKHVPDPKNPGKLKKISEAKPKSEGARRAEGQIILELDLDIVTLAEVENIAALQNFNDQYLGGRYNVYLIEGNDKRGIDIAFLVKKDLPFEIEQRSHKEETWVDPVLGGGPKLLFSRDLTSLVVRAPGKFQPLFVLFGTHYKSKRDRDGRDSESVILRTAQVQRTAEIMERYRAEFGADVPMMIAGDFNGDVSEEAAYKPLFDGAELTDSFDTVPVPPSKEERITHTFHPPGEPAHLAQMDAVLVSKSLRAAVQSANVYRYKNPDGTVRPIPKTYAERARNPSDHFPIYVTFDFIQIASRFFRR
ncbi:MAG: endonuclease/exonuclease/phosphatase family protein [Elusimicrobiota bacterium]